MNLKTLMVNTRILFKKTWNSAMFSGYKLVLDKKVYFEDTKEMVYIATMNSPSGRYGMVIRLEDIEPDRHPQLLNECKVRCTCPAYDFYLGYVLNKEKALEGDIRSIFKVYAPTVRNRAQIAGLCKHLWAFSAFLVNKKEIERASGV